ALVGRSDGVALVDISAPRSPIYLGMLPKSSGSATSGWRDIKVYQDKMYVVADNSDNGLQIFDLTALRDSQPVPRDFAESGRFDGFEDAHNIAINPESGFAYVVGATAGGQPHFSGGLVFLDLTREPTDSDFAVGGYAADGYTHDAQ